MCGCERERENEKDGTQEREYVRVIPYHEYERGMECVLERWKGCRVGMCL